VKTRVPLFLVMCASVLVACLGLSLAAAGQGRNGGQQGFPDDWSHNRLIFSNPGSMEQAKSHGRLEQWLRIVHDPRYRIQEMRRNQISTFGAFAPAPSSGSQSARTPMPDFSIPREYSSRWHFAGIEGNWSMDMGSGTRVPAGQYPAKYSFDGAPSCSDFVVFDTDTEGTPTQATIAAYSNLYSGTCTGSVPSVYWAYNTSIYSNTTLLTSPVLSADGSQIAFIENNQNGVDLVTAVLILLKWEANDGTPSDPATPTAVSNSDYRDCTAPCMTALVFTSTNNGNNSARFSSPFYDYADDILYVGDDGSSNGGRLHKFTGVFNGTPSEVTTSPWPVVLDTDIYELNSPVYDSTSGNVLVGDLGGYFHSVKAATGEIVGTSSRLGYAIQDAPLVDSTAETAYVVVADNLASSIASELYQFPATFTSGKGTGVTFGSGSSTVAVYDGALDNTYYTSGDGSSPTGRMYVLANPGGDATLYEIGINSNVISQSTVKTGPTLSSGGTSGSPVAETYITSASDGSFDWIYLSVQSNGSSSGCDSSGCLMNFLVTEWQSQQSYAVNQEILDTNLNIQQVIVAGTSGSSRPDWDPAEGDTTIDGSVIWINLGSMGLSGNMTASQETGGTSGIIVDNASGSVSQLSFSTLSNGTCTTSGGTGGCAIQASQSAP
jgi:hypothetical protein